MVSIAPRPDPESLEAARSMLGLNKQRTPVIYTLKKEAMAGGILPGENKMKWIPVQIERTCDGWVSPGIRHFHHMIVSELFDGKDLPSTILVIWYDPNDETGNINTVGSIPLRQANNKFVRGMLVVARLLPLGVVEDLRIPTSTGHRIVAWWGGARVHLPTANARIREFVRACGKVGQ